MFEIILFMLLHLILCFRSKRKEVNKGPRPVVIKKTDTGFGFNVRGQVSEGGKKNA